MASIIIFLFTHKMNEMTVWGKESVFAKCAWSAKKDLAHSYLQREDSDEVALL